MELKCNWCLASLATTELAITYPCGHKICSTCYSECMPHWCIVRGCYGSKLRAVGSVPETRLFNCHPRAPLHPAPQPPQASPQRQQPQIPPHPTQEPHVTLQIKPEPLASWQAKPHSPAPLHNITNTKPASPSQPCTPQEPRFSSPAGRQDSHQDVAGGTESSSNITQRPHRLLQGSEGAHPGTVSRIVKMFDSGAPTPLKGAAGYKDSEEPTAAQIPSVHTSSHHGTLSRNSDTQLLETLANTPSPQPKKTSTCKGPKPYPSRVVTRDPYLTSPRKEHSPPSRTSDAAPSPPSPTTCSPPLPGTSSMFYRRTESLHAGKDAKYSPQGTRGGDEATPPHTTTREPQLKQALTPVCTKRSVLCRPHRHTTSSSTITPMSGRPVMEGIVNGAVLTPQLGGVPWSPLQLSSPSQEVKRPCERCEEERRRHLDEEEEWRKEGERLHGEVTQLREAVSRQKELKRQQELQPSTYESLLEEIETLKQTNKKLVDEFNHKNKEIQRKDDELQWLKIEYEHQGKEILALQESEKGKSAGHQHEALLHEVISLNEQMKILTQEKSGLIEEVTSLREAKDVHIGEAIYWKEEYAKQQRAKQEEMDNFKLQELDRLQRRFAKWEGKLKEIQDRVVEKDGLIRQLIEKNNTQQNVLLQTEENLAKWKADATRVNEEKEFYIKESEKWEEEVNHLKQELSESEKVISQQKDELRELEGEIYTQDSRISDLMKKEKQNQEELAALRPLKEDVRCLIRERDTCEEERKKLEGEKAKLKEKMEQLRRERDDTKLKIHQLENQTPELGIKFSETINALITENDELRRKTDTQLEDVTQLRQEREKYKEEMEQLKGRGSNEISQMRSERDTYKEELEELRGRENTELEKVTAERDHYKEKVDKLENKQHRYKEELNEVNRRWNKLEQERDDLQRELDDFKRRKSTVVSCFERKEEALKEEIDELKRIKATFENQLTDAERERIKATFENQLTDAERDRDCYKEELKHLKSREAEVNQIIQMTVEKRDREETESRKAAQMEEAMHSHKEEIEKHLAKEAALEQRIRRVKIERENDTQNMNAKIVQMSRDIGYYKEQAEEHKKRVDTLEREKKQLKIEMENDQKGRAQERDDHKERIEDYRRREATMENLIEQMKKDEDNQQKETDMEIAKLWQEIGNCKGEIEYHKKNEEALRKQLKEVEKERNSVRMDLQTCQRENDNNKQKVQQLATAKSSLEEQITQTRVAKDKYWSERETYKRERDFYKGERDHYKHEVEQLKKRFRTEIVQRETRRDNQDRDQRWGEAEHLRRQQEVAERKAESPHTAEVLAAIGTPPVQWQQQAEGVTKRVDVVTVGPQVEEEVLVETLGLPNLGNSCYINSVVQCLYHLSPLRNTLTNSRLRHGQSGTGVALALAQLFGAMGSGSDSLVRASTEYFKEVIGSHDESFSGSQQQEVHDLYSALTSWLQSDLNQHDGLAAALFDGLNESKIVCEKSPSPLTNTSESFTSLSLPVLEHRQWPLGALLDNYFRKQSLMWDCEHCRSTHTCDHLTHIRHCPPVLVIHFSRFIEYSNTSKAKVEFPVAGLSLQRYMAPDAPPSPLYQLMGMVCHEGSMSYGHYTAYCRYGKGQQGGRWRLCNDGLVSSVSEREVLQDKNAHMLFYIQQGQ